MNRFYKKALAVLALLGCVALTGCSLKDKLSGTSGPKAISRPAVESAEVQFTHPAAGDTIAVFDTSAGVFKAVLFPTLAPQAWVKSLPDMLQYLLGSSVTLGAMAAMVLNQILPHAPHTPRASNTDGQSV